MLIQGPVFRQFFKYFGVALVGYVVDFTTLIITTNLFGFHYLIGASAGFITGLVVVYVLSGKYVFGTSKIASKYAEFGVFCLIGLVGLGILNVLMFITTSGLHINYIVSKVLATVVVYIWNFGARRALYRN